MKRERKRRRKCQASAFRLGALVCDRREMSQCDFIKQPSMLTSISAVSRRWVE
jgi:hypothetical protein